MEDEKGLDLSLGLPCGGNSSSQKSKQGSSSDARSDEGDRGSKLINEFKNFLEGGNQHPLKVGESFSYNFPKPADDLEIKKNSNAEGLWLPNDTRSLEIDEKSSVGDKRKNLFIETNQQKKHERETNHPDLTDKPKASHISITTDEGSTAENEDVADSEVDGSTSRHVSQHDDVKKRFVSTSGISKVQKESHAFGDSSGVEILGQKRFTISSEKEFNVMNMSVPYSVSHSAPSTNMNMTHSQTVKDSNSSGTPNLPNYPLPSMMHAMTTSNVERSGVQQVIPANFPVMFGYTPVQLPVLDRDNSRGIVTHHQQIHPTYSGRNPGNPDTQNDGRKLTQVLSHKTSESTPFDARVGELGKAYRKQQVGEEGSSSHTESDQKENNAIHQVKDASDQPRADSLPTEYPAIRPGITADLKFGGCGSYPNLPWVSTTGSGPNGRTISGVTYKFSPTQIKIVCACHGSHMSPDEFIQHASEENNSPDTGAGLASLSGSNPAASAQS